MGQGISRRSYPELAEATLSASSGREPTLGMGQGISRRSYPDLAEGTLSASSGCERSEAPFLYHLYDRHTPRARAQISLTPPQPAFRKPHHESQRKDHP